MMYFDLEKWEPVTEDELRGNWEEFGCCYEMSFYRYIDEATGKNGQLETVRTSYEEAEEIARSLCGAVNDCPLLSKKYGEDDIAIMLYEVTMHGEAESVLSALEDTHTDCETWDNIYRAYKYIMCREAEER